MVIIETSVEKMGSDYRRLFIDVFDRWESHHNPDIVFLFLTDDESDVMGFASGFATKPTEIYMQWGGERKQYRGFKSKNRLRQLRDYLHDRGWKYILTTVSAENNQMLRLYLGIGYKVFGTKHSTDGMTYVELIHAGGN